MIFTPDSWGAAREANSCHDPKDGRFCSNNLNRGIFNVPSTKCPSCGSHTSTSFDVVKSPRYGKVKTRIRTCDRCEWAAGSD